MEILKFHLHHFLVLLLFLERGKEKNKYGMLALNFNRRTNVAMEHNVFGLGEVAEHKSKIEKQNLIIKNESCAKTQ